jgi:hypothetical protein
MNPADITDRPDLPVFDHKLTITGDTVQRDLLEYLQHVTADYDAVDAFIIAGELIVALRGAANQMANLRRAAAREGKRDPGIHTFAKLTGASTSTLRRLIGERVT